MNLEGHPTVRRVAAQTSLSKAQPVAKTIVDSTSLRRLALDCGVDDAGLVEITRPGLEPQREEILSNYPWTNCWLSIVLRRAREPVRGTPRSTSVVRTDETLLDAADCAGVFIDNACRSGTCGSCRIKLVSGRVGMVMEDALTTQDKADGYILTCQAKVQGDVKVDA